MSGKILKLGTCITIFSISSASFETEPDTELLSLASLSETGLTTPNWSVSNGFLEILIRNEVPKSFNSGVPRPYFLASSNIRGMPLPHC